MRIPACSPLAIFLLAALPVGARGADSSEIPVQEVTVFKDGHAFVLHEGEVPTDPEGNVLLDYLPEPVIGTFWPYSQDSKADLVSVVAGRRARSVQRTALTLGELLQANIGSEALIAETDGPRYQATILQILAPGADEAERPSDGEADAPAAQIVLLETVDGTRAVSLDRIQDLTFLNGIETSWNRQEFRNRLLLKLDWQGRGPAPSAQVGMVYLQKGIRWIPSYKVNLVDGGEAQILFQATLVNELTDLEDVTANLVIGVPSFTFKETLDPIALQESAAQLSQHFRPDQRTAYAFSNAIMTQSASMVEAAPVAVASDAGDWGDQVSGQAKNEDLFVFSVQRIWLKKGDRMVVPIAEFRVTYQDVFALDLPFAPPPEMHRSLGAGRQAELARLFKKPTVRHKIRLTNSSPYPLTTAPALIVRDNRLMAQGLMTYTASGGACDLDAGAAIDIQVVKQDNETRRVPDAVRWRGDHYARIELAGSIRLTNRRGKPSQIEVTRWVLGNLDSSQSQGEVSSVNIFEDSSFLPSGEYPIWWGWYSWPYWWRHFNGISRIAWTVDLENQQSRQLDYSWHYFWR